MDLTGMEMELRRDEQRIMRLHCVGRKTVGEKERRKEFVR
jgi:hypothetical protein